MKGNFPEYDNEIVVTGLLARSWGRRWGYHYGIFKRSFR